MSVQKTLTCIYNLLVSGSLKVRGKLMRNGGTNIQLTNISSGSFQVNGTRYRVYSNMRASNDMLLLIGYTSPVTFANASVMLIDMESYEDNVPEGTTVYFTLINPATFNPANGTAMDFIYTSIYD